MIRSWAPMAELSWDINIAKLFIYNRSGMFFLREKSVIKRIHLFGTETLGLPFCLIVAILKYTIGFWEYLIEYPSQPFVSRVWSLWQQQTLLCQKYASHGRPYLALSPNSSEWWTNQRWMVSCKNVSRADELHIKGSICRIIGQKWCTAFLNDAEC